MNLRSISAQLSALITVLIVLTIGALIFFATASSYESTIENQEANIKTLNNQIVSSTEHILASNIASTQAFGERRYVVNALRYNNARSIPIKEYQNTVESLDLISSLLVTDTQGNILGGVNEKNETVTDGREEDEKLIEAVAQGKKYIAGYAVRSEKTGDALVKLAAPIIDPITEKVLGGVIACLDWSRISENFISHVTIGKAGYIVVTDNAGVVITHPDKTVQFTSLAGFDFMQQALQHDETAIFYSWKGKKKALISATIPATGFKVLSTSYADDLAAAAATQRNMLMLTGTVAAVTLIAVVLFFMQRMVIRPLRCLQDYTNSVASGNLSAVMTGSHRYEMAALSTGLQNMVQELKDKLAFSRSVLEGITLPLLIVDKDEKATFINTPCLEMLQIDKTPEQCLGRTLADLFYNDPGRKTAVGRSMAEKQVISNLEVTITGHKGRQTEVLANVTYLQDMEGTITGGMCLYLDMTEFKKQQRRIAEQNKRIAETAENAGNIAEQLASASAELSSQIEQSSRGTDIQRERTGETAAAMEQMNATVLEVARNATATAGLSEQTKQKAFEGGRVAQQTIEKITLAHEQALALKADMAELGQQAEGIGAIMNVIADIADQTNLLALNAAIEAARAGDAGRGFAVVADEVRKLAEKTMSATQEVGQSIKRIQQSTQKNIRNTESAATAISAGAEMVTLSGKALEEIMQLVQESADQVNSIATAAEEQSATSEQINRSTEEITRIADETAMAMQSSSQAVADLARLADDLHTVIAQMKSDNAA
ncbi:methyl-accepting chemotaxis sensory transducer with Cache sensor [Oleidesulfovibrio alaskensis G20]|uniref:Methyl-accepting chemotaxis sensory transducer with Cache sensor n=1 Tax=Oleidesulfovibrio alaskensis (strain ATCC BAA-1058 / DSM 17464 / G20) TaxID=207559 RepID=Q311D4_OLEA2|nr:methyl-accepting chemotaxis protein [Oleidesulfovibrio alaskensis]ABB38462.1 methyl-accepting chemotaxis sensory transducer with Cache sensor [Oleidesulfovibrio alaskensis G20]MBG0773642.1 PAS domain-containing protein [Oleidesulfovibrio alaskensis]